MISEVKLSQQLSKRYKRDSEFKEIINTSKIIFTAQENGIIEEKQACDDNQSLFSTNQSKDTEEEVDNLTGEQKRKMKSTIERYKYMKYLKHQKNLRKSKWHKIKLSVVPIKFESQIHPIKKIRFLEYNQLLDSDVFLESTTIDFREFNLVLNIYDEKRVSSVTYDKKKDGFIIKMCEKYFRKIDSRKDYIGLDYYIEWLKSLGNKLSMVYLDSLLKLKESFEMNKSLVRYYKNQVENIDNSKIFIKQIDQDTLNYIYKGPFFNRISKVDLAGSNENSGLVQEEYSMSFLQMMGYDCSDIDQILSKFMKHEIQCSFYTKSYVNNVCDIFNKCYVLGLDLEKEKIQAPKTLSERFCLRDRHGEDCVEFRVNTWEEKWYENGSLYKTSYSLPWDVKYISKKLKDSRR